MAVRDILNELRIQIYIFVEKYTIILAKFFGYPENPGMPIIEPGTHAKWRIYTYLPTRKTSNFPPITVPENLVQALFGKWPVTNHIDRVIFENKLDGYYNFYILNFKNIFFLPDWLSEFIQIRFNLCLDIGVLELARDVGFLIIFLYYKLLETRLMTFWFLTINPYTRPWVYFLGITDWIEELAGGFVPTILGVDTLPGFFITFVGYIGDSLNHLVFTMPFLPSEGRQAKMMINGELKDIIVFRHLPILWYKYPIPEDVKEFWYYKRPDILDYMIKNYQNLDIDFYPTSILKEIYEHQDQHLTNLDMIKDISTQITSENIDSIYAFSNYLNYYQEECSNFFVKIGDRLIS